MEGSSYRAMSIASISLPFHERSVSYAHLIEALRSHGLLGASNHFGAPDEKALFSTGIRSSEAEFTLIAGPATRRWLLIQPDLSSESPEQSHLSQLTTELDIEPDPPALKVLEQCWQNGAWQDQRHLEGWSLAEAMRSISASQAELSQDHAEYAVQPGALLSTLKYDLFPWTQSLLPSHYGATGSMLGIIWQVDRWLIHDRNHQELKILAYNQDKWLEKCTGILQSDHLPVSSEHLAQVNPEDPGVSSHSDREHADIVRRVQRAIQNGEFYQLNFGRKWQGALGKDPWLIMKDLLDTNPAPNSAWIYVPDQDLALCSSSPELLLSSENGTLRTRPIKGTRPRGHDDQEEEREREQLLNSPKERAEHRMLVDLERNDLGMVSETGSVRHSQFQIESYPNVHHLVSEVTGQLHSSRDIWDALQAMFPGGSITGCPKTVAIAGINDLEAAPRSFWTGSIGIADPGTGFSKWSILIRTLEAQKDAQGMWQGTIQAGGGLVAGSDPEEEVREAKWKARALRESAGWLDGTSPENRIRQDELAVHPQPLSVTEPVSDQTGEIRRWPATPDGSSAGHLIMIDNLDSFTWNIAHAVAAMGVEVTLVNGFHEGSQILDELLDTDPSHLIIGPGPGHPQNSPLSLKLAEMALSGDLHIPLLGICLGFQAIGLSAGLTLEQSPSGPVHGIPVLIEHDGREIMHSLPNPVKMVRYNSLTLAPGSTVSDLTINGWERGPERLAMTFHHDKLPIYGVQFHPESVGSQSGIRILQNFLTRQA